MQPILSLWPKLGVNTTEKQGQEQISVNSNDHGSYLGQNVGKGSTQSLLKGENCWLYTMEVKQAVVMAEFGFE